MREGKSHIYNFSVKHFNKSSIVCAVIICVWLLFLLPIISYHIQLQQDVSELVY